jgi:hypothetical protein
MCFQTIESYNARRYLAGWGGRHGSKSYSAYPESINDTREMPAPGVDTVVVVATVPLLRYTPLTVPELATKVLERQ